MASTRLSLGVRSRGPARHVQRTRQPTVALPPAQRRPACRRRWAGACSASSDSSGPSRPDGMTPSSRDTAGDGASDATRGGGKPDKPPGLRQRLAELGLSGVIAYGLLNTLYYVCAFLLFFTTIADVPKGMGFGETFRKVAEAFALTWAGSQVTKIPRLAGAVALAPLINKLLDLIQRRLRLDSRNQAPTPLSSPLYYPHRHCCRGQPPHTPSPCCVPRLSDAAVHSAQAASLVVAGCFLVAGSVFAGVMLCWA
eukprot:jgi/Tetstr1/465476/TSEL_010160.t1